MDRNAFRPRAQLEIGHLTRDLDIHTDTPRAQPVFIHATFTPGTTHTANVNLTEPIRSGDIYLDEYIVDGVPTAGGLPTVQYVVVRVGPMTVAGASTIANGIELPLDNSTRTCRTAVGRFVGRIVIPIQPQDLTISVFTPTNTPATLSDVVLKLRSVPYTDYPR